MINNEPTTIGSEAPAETKVITEAADELGQAGQELEKSSSSEATRKAFEIQEDPTLLQRTQQLNTMKIVGTAVNKLGVEDNVFLTGGYVLEATGAEGKRAHKDIDIVMLGAPTAQQVAAELQQTGSYGEHAAIEGTSLMTLRPHDAQQFSEIDFWWVDEVSINGVPCLIYTIDPKFQAFLGKPFGFPKSALADTTIQVGDQALRYIRPELLALSFGQDEERVAGIDQNALDPEVSTRIQNDITAAGILVNIDPKIVEAFNASQKN